MAASGFIILLLALFVFTRLVAGKPRLADVILKGPKRAAAEAAG